MRRAVILVVSVATIAVALAADVSKPLAMFAAFVVGASVAVEARRMLAERDQTQPVEDVDEVDDEPVDERPAWPAPQTPRLEDRERYGWRGEGSPKYARAAARVSLAVVDEHRLDRDEWAARPLDRAWHKLARDLEHEPLAVKIDRLATPILDRFDERFGDVVVWFINRVDAVGEWLAAHEPSFGWTKRVGTHALDLLPVAAPVREVTTGEQRVVRFVDVDDGRVLDLPVAYIDTDTAEWVVPSEWLYEPVGATR